MKDWALAASHLMQRPFDQDSYASKLINGYIALVSQTYTGDINILPSSRFLSPTQALASRSSEQVMELLSEGERATWPKIERIRIQTHISRTLNRLIDEIDHAVASGGRRAAHPKRKVVKSLTLVETKVETNVEATVKPKKSASGLE
jgi:TAG lipase/steryl ester hydrolase/phospholipase A2/LPA acyltransferase